MEPIIPTAELEKLHPKLRWIAESICSVARCLLARHEAMDGHRLRFIEGFRPHDKQWRLFKRGREKRGERWVVVKRRQVVTYARPNESPHCVVLGGKPAALAMDLAIITPENTWLRDGHPSWALIPAAAAIVAPNEIEMGASFKRIPGGDWPHLQWAKWRSLTFADVR